MSISLSKKDLEWADDFGMDEFGIWAEFSYKGVVQRLRYIPPNTFMMGSPDDEPERYRDEGPQREVTIEEGYWMADTACTQELWEAVMGSNPSHFKGYDLPVENVSWNDCQEFIKRINEAIPGINLSLPSEAQWECACRAGTTTPFSFGENITTDQVNYDGNYPYNNGEKGEYRKKTVPVKSLPPNPWGLYEMHGNTWEWVQDKYEG